MTFTDLMGLLGGLALFLYGMQMMSTGLEAAAGNKMKVILEKLTANRFVGVLVGAGITAVIQSSSASVGILQALAGSGVIGLNSAAFVLFGQNIGTCITALLASVGTSRNAKRATLIHIMFNVIGTIVFTTLCLATPLTSLVQGWTPGNVPAQIANLHTTFNIVTTILLIPFGAGLTKLATLILKDKAEEVDDEVKVHYLLDIKHINTEKLGAYVICLESIKKELMRMLDMSKSNVLEAFDVFKKQDKAKYEAIEKREEYVDYLNKEISKYITSAVTHEGTSSGSTVFNALYAITSNIERISDHAMNIAGYSHMIAEKVACMEQKIDDVTVQYRNNMFV